MENVLHLEIPSKIDELESKYLDRSSRANTEMIEITDIRFTYSEATLCAWQIWQLLNTIMLPADQLQDNQTRLEWYYWFTSSILTSISVQTQINFY